jgi:hypothetical protein
MEHLAFNFEVELIKKETEGVEPELIRPDKAIKHLHRAVAAEMRPNAGTYWQGHQASVGIISKNQFKTITGATLNRMHYQAWTIALEHKARQWSSGRQRALTDAVQKIDSATDMKTAEDMWEEVLTSQIFKGVDEETLQEKASEIRAVCLSEKGREGIVERIWNDLRGLRWKQAETSSYIRNHPTLYKEQKEWTLGELKRRMLEEIMKTGNVETRNMLWHRMIALSGVAEASNTNSEYRIYKLWWIAINNTRTLLAKEVEWDKAADRYLWEGFKLDGPSLRSWATEKIRKSAGGQVPHILRAVSEALELEEGQKKEILDSYFRELEGEEDFAERWWKSAKHQALPLEDLARRFEEERERSKNGKVLKEEMQRRWISSLTDQEASGSNPLKTVEALGLVKTLRVEADSSMEAKPDQALESWEVEEDCEKALDKLK